MMPGAAASVRSLFRSWLHDYDRVQSAAVVLIYVQIACALVGSLGALYNGLLLIHFMVALFALVAIENSSEKLVRTYAVLLASGILLDIFWFILFSHEIWNISSEKYGQLFVLSLKLTLWMQILGFFVRSFSSLLWIQIYRLGVSSVGSAAYMAADIDDGNAYLNPPTNEIVRQNSNCNAISGGSIFDPACYFSLFEDTQEKRHLSEGHKQSISHHSGSTSAAEPRGHQQESSG